MNEVQAVELLAPEVCWYIRVYFGRLRALSIPLPIGYTGSFTFYTRVPYF